MVPFVSLFLGIVLGLILLWPPLAFVRALYRYLRNVRSDLGFVMRAVWLVAGAIPFTINLGYMYLSWGLISAGQLSPDINMALAGMSTWFSFWARIALMRRNTRRRRRRT